MKNTIKLEELVMLVLSIYCLYYLKADWWYYLLLAVGPDISMIGYIRGNKSGAVLYNLFHHKGLAVIIFILGFHYHLWIPQVIGTILFGHSSMDRMFGYGLKKFEGFNYTHLGIIGNKPH